MLLAQHGSLFSQNGAAELRRVTVLARMCDEGKSEGGGGEGWSFRPDSSWIRGYKCQCCFANNLFYISLDILHDIVRENIVNVLFFILYIYIYIYFNENQRKLICYLSDIFETNLIFAKQTAFIFF